MRPRRAIILAAGAGRRLSLGGPGVPKPLLPVTGVPGSATLLDRQAACLAAAGVRDIFIVGNSVTFGSPVSPQSARVEWILNDTAEAADTGSGHSAWIAFTSAYRILDGESDVLLMDADIAYGRELLPSVLEASDGGYSRIVVTTETAPYDDAVLVYADTAGFARIQGKRLSGSRRVEALGYAGIATGIVIWHPDDHAALRGVADRAMTSSPARTRTEHEEVTQEMMEMGRVRLAEIPPKCPFIEVDTPADYEELVLRVAPRLT